VQPGAVLYIRVSTKDQAERGGEAEGFSLPAQREACRRKAEQLGAPVIAEFADAGESARSTARPDLQRMLRFLTENPVSYVIVHKVDRLARNRADDVQINLAIQQAGAVLVSCTENIDETPSGVLLHGIMSSIAEFYSKNLANESRKGMLQKVKSGGTPGKAPFGYTNVRSRSPEGREIRTVEVDADRAEAVRWLFQAYATGDWTMNMLRDELDRQGITARPTPKFPARTLAISQIERILKNRYYLGEVRYEGVWYPGRHQAIIGPELWEQVQTVRRGRQQSGEKPRQHPHYLKGSLYCGQCGELLGVEVVRNHQGRSYPYFYCLGRQKQRNGCQLRATPIDLVEQKIIEHWRTITLSSEDLAAVRANVMTYLEQVLPQRNREVERAARTIAELTAQRDKLLQAHYADAVPLDQLKVEQERIARQLAAAHEALSGSRLQRQQLEDTLDRALVLLERGDSQYAAAPSIVRRDLNQAVFERFWLIDDEIAEAQFTALFDRLRPSSQPASEMPKTGPGNRKNPRPEGTGSNEPLLVAGTGFEPATSGL
jgi:site-specific DNA recombinase